MIINNIKTKTLKEFLFQKILSNPGFICLTICCSIAVFLSTYKITDFSLFANELYPISTSQLNFDELLKKFFNTSDLIGFYGGHKPFFYHTITWIWAKLFGRDIFTLRMSSVLPFILVIIISQRLVQSLLKDESALNKTLPFLLCTLPFLIWWAQVFSYPMWLTLFNLLSMYFYVKLLANEMRRSFGLSTGYIMSMALSFYTHYFSICLIMFQLIFLFFYSGFSPGRKTPWGKWTVIAISLVLLMTPGLFVFIHSVPLMIRE